MGYSHYILSDGREAGYAVEAECDHPNCRVQINRGLGHLCGTWPSCGEDPDGDGCGDYFCDDHRFTHDCPNDQFKYGIYITRIRQTAWAGEFEWETRWEGLTETGKEIFLTFRDDTGIAVLYSGDGESVEVARFRTGGCPKGHITLVEFCRLANIGLAVRS